MSEQALQVPADEPGFFILNHYLFDLSVECPGGRILPEDVPRVAQGYDLRVSVFPLEGEGRNRVDIFVRLTAQVGERVVFMAELNYRVEVQFQNIPEAQLKEFLLVHVPNAVQPALRQIFEQNGAWCGYPDMRVGELNFAKAYDSQPPATPLH